MPGRPTSIDDSIVFPAKKKKGRSVSRVPCAFRRCRHLSRSPVSRDLQRSTRGLPRPKTRHGPAAHPLLDLARSEACRAVSVAGNAVGSYPTLSPLPCALAGAFGGLLSVALSVVGAKPRRPAVSRRCAVASPDFPPPRPRKAGTAAVRPAPNNPCRVRRAGSFAPLRRRIHSSVSPISFSESSDSSS